MPSIECKQLPWTLIPYRNVEPTRAVIDPVDKSTRTTPVPRRLRRRPDKISLAGHRTEASGPVRQSSSPLKLPNALREPALRRTPSSSCLRTTDGSVRVQEPQ